MCLPCPLCRGPTACSLAPLILAAPDPPLAPLTLLPLLLTCVSGDAGATSGSVGWVAAGSLYNGAMSAGITPWLWGPDHMGVWPCVCCIEHLGPPAPGGAKSGIPLHRSAAVCPCTDVWPRLPQSLHCFHPSPNSKLSLDWMVPAAGMG